jgi:hypothetical protein
MTLYSYNQLVALLGKDNKQVKLVEEYIKSIGWCDENKTKEAFRLSARSWEQLNKR